jgi:hypothetical protein
MKAKTFFSSITIILGIVLFYSCKKELKENIVPNTSLRAIPTNITYQNLMLKFQTPASFQETLSILDSLDALETQDNDSIFKVFETRFLGYVSKRKQLRDAEDAILATDSLNDNNDPERLFTPDDAVKTVINFRGEVQIGDTIYVFQPFHGEHKIFTTLANNNLVNNLQAYRQAVNNNTLNAFFANNNFAQNDVTPILEEETCKKNSVGRTYNFYYSANGMAKCKAFFRRYARFRTGYGGKTTHFVKTRGRWRRGTAPDLSVAFVGQFYNHNCTIASQFINMVDSRKNVIKVFVRQNIWDWQLARLALLKNSGTGTIHRITDSNGNAYETRLDLTLF